MHSTNFCGPIRSRRLAEYSTMMCGMLLTSFGISKGALDFPRRPLGHPNQRRLSPVFEARRDARHTHRRDRMPLRIPDHHADARDLLDDVALGERVLANPHL